MDQSKYLQAFHQAVVDVLSPEMAEMSKEAQVFRLALEEGYAESVIDKLAAKYDVQEEAVTEQDVESDAVRNFIKNKLNKG